MTTETDFPAFSKAVHARLTRMSREELFVVETTDIFASYLAAFPEGTNPMFRTRTEHDCSCCKQFVRNFGRTVAIIDGRRYTVWGGGENLPSPYREVAERMDALVQQAPISGVFRTKERRFGAEQTIQMIDGHPHRWHHFWGVVADRHRCDNPDQVRGDLNTTAQVLRRGLTELRASAIDDVLTLIEDGAIYRGAEHLRAVKEFQKLQREFAEARDPELSVWANIKSPAARFRGTVIGTLVDDLSNGMDIDQAVRSFEAKVAPHNYKRPKALITPKMVEAALKTLADLGLDGAVERRFARLADVSVNDVLFVDNEVRGKMRNGLRDVLMGAAVAPVRSANATPVTIDEFVTRVLPGARSMALHLKNEHLPKFMSITAPQHEDAGRLFKWDNGFAWTYDGDVADSIKERVKRAGGNTGAPLRVSLAWSNYDDLDIHAHCPDGHVYFSNKKMILDVDMNAGSGTTRSPVENLSWVSPRNGAYRIDVNNFSKRESKDVGFTLEVECNGTVQQFSCRTSPRSGETISCFEFTMQGGRMSDLKVLDTSIHGGSVPTEKWGVRTESNVRVNTLLTSPNHWEGAGGVGAKHWFFILEGCKNPDDARGIYNEFLRGDLEPHRRVFEVLGAKTKCPRDDQQLSGVGFTMGRGDRVLVTASTATGNSRTYEISF